MASNLASQWIVTSNLFIALGLGVAAIIALATIACRKFHSMTIRAAIWRITTVSLFLLVLLEVTGLGPGVVRIWRQQVVVQSFNTEPTATKSSSAHEAQASDAVTDEEEPTIAVSTPAIQPSLPAAIAPASEEPYGPSAPGATPWLIALWALGAVSVLCWILVGQFSAYWFRRRCVVLDDAEIANRVAALRARLAVNRPVAVLTSSRIVSPIVLGGWRPALVLPATFAGDFDHNQQETILAHELAHLATHDVAWQAAAFLVCAFVWWHPLVWWSRRQLRAAHEGLADEASLLLPDGPQILAEALLNLGQRLLASHPRFGLSLGGRYRSSLGQRVERLLSMPPGPWRAPRRARMAFVHFSLPGLVALAAIFGTAWASQAPTFQGETTMNVLTSSWRCSLVATALWTMLGNSPAPAVAADENPSASAAADRGKINEPFRAIREKAAQLDKEGKHEDAERLRRQAAEMMKNAHDGASSSDRETAPGPVRVIREKAAQLDKDGKHEDAERLRREASEMMKNARGGATSSSAPSGPEKERILGRLKEMSQKISQLEKDGKHDEAAQLKREARELYGKLGGSRDTVAMSSPERRKMYEQYKALQEKIEAAKQSHNEDDVHRLMQEMDALRGKMHTHEASTQTRYSTSGGDRAQRMQHLRAAAENLKAAGCEPEAQHVMEMIQHMESEGRVSAGTLVITGVTTAIQPDVNDLRSQVEQMRREMREMREELNKAKGGDRR